MYSFFHTKEFITSDSIKICFEGNLSCTENIHIQGNSLISKLLNGYKAWGIDLFEKLEFNFAIVIEDKLENKIIVARDRFGLEPLYYTKLGDTYHFSQNITDLSKLSPELNEERIAGYLDAFTASYSNLYDTSTFYKNIKSVLPAHYTVFSDTIEAFPYWKPTPVSYHASEVYNQFRELLVNSVKANTASYTKVASQMSGGLDSSSLAVLYSKINKPVTLFMDPGIPENLDPYYCREVVKSIDSDHYTLSPERNIYPLISNLSSFSGHPDYSLFSSALMVSVSQKARELQCDAMLSGHDGDTVIDHGREYLYSLKEKGEWYVFCTMLTQAALSIETSDTYPNWREMSAEKRIKIVKTQRINNEILKLLKSRDIIQIKKLLADSRREFGFTPLSFISFLAKKVYDKIRYPSISSNLSISHKIKEQEEESLEQLYSFNRITDSYQFKTATSRTFININEQLTALGRQYGQSFLFPFFERRLLEFSMSVPDEVKYGGGLTRALLRKGLKKDLPAELLKRRGKSDFTKYALPSSINLWEDNKDKFMTNSEIWEIVNQKSFLKNMEIAKNPTIPLRIRSNAIIPLNRVMYLSIWLDTLK
jgi:asparagine synthase (glutamine-hydrolysing)